MPDSKLSWYTFLNVIIWRAMFSWFQVNIHQDIAFPILQRSRALKGPGVFIWQIRGIDFILFSNRGQWDLLAAFYLIKILILAKDIARQKLLSALKCNCIAHTSFNRDFCTWLFFKFQNLSSPTFFEQSSEKLSGYVFFKIFGLIFYDFFGTKYC